ncbi:hypothetical protein AVEN_182430-1 [Araneus ventricosus]|uniref:Uncharacterized protein n=1 Tax=Araneus ventricosus TaxID=182803 RepID=A0A4Y1ZNN5_ARAVE|nr:hypothetical protein AVEN_182430-1 [Araneus ventricosus]
MVNHIKRNHQDIKKFNYFSDGASGQYKKEKKKKLLTYVTIRQILIWKLSGISLLRVTVKAPVMVWVVPQNDRLPKQVSNDYTLISNELSTPESTSPVEMFEFCQEHFKGITFTYIKDLK